MKEFDFEELDKAVNTLMTDAKDKGEATSEPKTPEDDLRVVELSDVKPEEVKPAEPAETPKTVPDSTSTKSVAPPRKSGRFMDVVHPSSDMRPGLRTHESANVTPLSTDVAPEAAEKPEEATENPVQTSEPDLDTSFDPIAFQEKRNAETQTEPEVADLGDDEATPDTLQEAVVAPVDPSTDEKPAEETPPETPSNDSPFLADAKVEKRPLGGGAASTPEAGDTATETAEEVKDEPAPTPQPAELGSDILAIESGEASSAPEEVAKDEAKEDAPKYEGVKTTDAPASAASVSIVQQYKEKGSSTPEEHEAIYDSAAQPALAHPAKKRSGWWIVLWIALLLALGGGGAAVLYMMNMI